MRVTMQTQIWREFQISTDPRRVSSKNRIAQNRTFSAHYHFPEIGDADVFVDFVINI